MFTLAPFASNHTKWSRLVWFGLDDVRFFLNDDDEEDDDDRFDIDQEGFQVTKFIFCNPMSIRLERRKCFV